MKIRQAFQVRGLNDVPLTLEANDAGEIVLVLVGTDGVSVRVALSRAHVRALADNMKHMAKVKN